MVDFDGSLVFINEGLNFGIVYIAVKSGQTA